MVNQIHKIDETFLKKNENIHTIDEKLSESTTHSCSFLLTVHLDHREIQTSSDPDGWPARVPDDVSYRELAKRDPLIECLICGILRGNSFANMKAYVN